MPRNSRARVATALCGASLLLVAACGGADDSKDSVSTSDAPAAEIVDRATSDIPFEGPETSPAPTSDATIAIIECAAAAAGCVRVASGVQDAGDLLGWEVKVLDGQGQASGQNAAIQQAVSQGVDGIILAAFNSEAVSQGMTAAENAGIPVVSVEAGNPVGDGPTDVYAEPDTGAVAAGEMLAALVATDSDGKAKVATLTTDEVPVTVQRHDAFMDQIDKCTGCEVLEEQNYLLSTAIKDVPLKVKSILQANPDLQYLFVDIGQYGALAVQAIDEAGSDVKVVSVDCNADDLANIESGDTQLGCAAHGLESGGWAGVGALVFALGDEETADDFVVPTKLIVKDNLPDGDIWQGDFDPEDAYGQLWGMN